MANLLEKELSSHDTFQNFLSDCHQCRLQIQQTELAFACPPPQRSQCRFFNLSPLLRWANCLLNSNLFLFRQLIPTVHLNALWLRLQDKFSWLASYREPLQLWNSLLDLIHTLEFQVKSLGFNDFSSSLFQENLYDLDVPPSLSSFLEKLFTYLEQESSSASHPLLATSDVLESIFGRYKFFSQRCPIKELRSMLLTIPLTTVQFTSSFIQEALCTISVQHLSQWVDQTFGQSMLSKRKILFAQAGDFF